MPRNPDKRIERTYLRIIRLSVRMSFPKYSRTLGFSKRTYENYEVGTRHFSKEVADELFSAINEHFDVPVSWLEQAEVLYQQRVEEI